MFPILPVSPVWWVIRYVPRDSYIADRQKTDKTPRRPEQAGFRRWLGTLCWSPVDCCNVVLNRPCRFAKRGISVVTLDNDHPLSEADLARLLQCHRRQLAAMVRRRLDPALSVRLDADDILSEAFIRARRKWRSFRLQANMTGYAWLYRIVLDCLIEAWRRESRSRRDMRRDMPWPDISSEEMESLLVSAGTSPSQAARTKELQARVRQALQLLSVADREILSMRHFDSLSFLEIAEVLGVSQNASNVRYARALRRLKDVWESLNSDTGGEQ